VPTASDDDLARNKKETKRLIFSPERFLLPKLHHSFNHNKELEKPEGIVQFTEKCLKGEMPDYFESEPIPKQKYTQKVVAEDFANRVLKSQKPVLMLITHPVKAKNHGI
jgi:hypothetical protein